MKEVDLHELIITVFAELRRFNSGLGIRELLDALRLVDFIGQDESLDERDRALSLRSDIELLWCRSRSEQQELSRIWENRKPKMPPSAPAPADTPSTTGDEIRSEPNEPPPDQPRETPRQPESKSDSAVASVLPVKPPWRMPTRAGPAELGGFWPVSRRAMEYGWEYLRRPREDGPATILDIKATVERAARQGYVLDPVYRQETRNHSHLVLMVDRKGSMMPFHPLARDVVETARGAEKEDKIGRLDVVYFSNAATDHHLFRDERLSQRLKTGDRPATLEETLARCRRDTRIMIVSDAGAARGRRSLERIEATDDMIFHIRQKSRFIAWLNPMPEPRWKSTSAKVIAEIAPMFEMTRLGFHDAIRALRGQKTQR